MTNRSTKAAKDFTVKGEEGRSITRVFHPSLDTWHDVPTEQVGDWHDAGWTAEPGDHNNVDTYPSLAGSNLTDGEINATVETTGA